MTAEVHCVSSHQPCLGVKPKELPFKTHVARGMQPLLPAALAVNFNSIHPADACHYEVCAELLTNGCGRAFLHRRS